jgi:hypothetical protein
MLLAVDKKEAALREELAFFRARVAQLEGKAPDAERERLVTECSLYLLKYAAKPMNDLSGEGARELGRGRAGRGGRGGSGGRGGRGGRGSVGLVCSADRKPEPRTSMATPAQLELSGESSDDSAEDSSLC